jgi:hypothetical protein
VNEEGYGKCDCNYGGMMGECKREMKEEIYMYIHFNSKERNAALFDASL